MPAKSGSTARRPRKRQFEQLGVNPFVLRPGEPMPCTPGKPIGATVDEDTTDPDVVYAQIPHSVPRRLASRAANPVCRVGRVKLGGDPDGGESSPDGQIRRVSLTELADVPAPPLKFGFAGSQAMSPAAAITGSPAPETIRGVAARWPAQDRSRGRNRARPPSRALFMGPSGSLCEHPLRPSRRTGAAPLRLLRGAPAGVQRRERHRGRVDRRGVEHVRLAQPVRPVANPGARAVDIYLYRYMISAWHEQRRPPTRSTPWPSHADG